MQKTDLIGPKFKKNNNKTQKTHPGWFFKKKPGFLPTLTPGGQKCPTGRGRPTDIS
jgi:hypothetical protein